MTNFQLYVASKGCEAAAEQHDEAGRENSATLLRQRAWEHRRELTARLKGLAARWGRVPAQVRYRLREVA
jgi:hypothetical protein